MRTLTLIIISIFLSCNNNDKYSIENSDFKQPLKNHLISLSKENELPVKDTSARNYLENDCTLEDLKMLLRHEKPLLRIIAYRTIVNRNEKESFQILLNHLDDTAKVNWWYLEDACNTFTISDLMIKKVSDYLTRAEKDTLINLVITKYNYLEVTSSMLADINVNEKYYDIIKSKTQNTPKNCHELELLVTLAKYKKNKDIDYLKARISKFDKENSFCSKYNFTAIEVNPDERYFEILESYFQNWKKNKVQYDNDALLYFCRALAVYKKPRCLEIFNEILDKKNYSEIWYLKHNELSILKAIHKYSSPIYDELYTKIKSKTDKYELDHIDDIEYYDETYWNK